jgi:hypothetical protein
MTSRPARCCEQGLQRVVALKLAMPCGKGRAWEASWGMVAGAGPDPRLEDCPLRINFNPQVSPGRLWMMPTSTSSTMIGPCGCAVGCSSIRTVG